MCALNVFVSIDDLSAATEPERLAHISLGQENPRMRMNAAPGRYLHLSMNRNYVHNINILAIDDTRAHDLPFNRISARKAKVEELQNRNCVPKNR